MISISSILFAIPHFVTKDTLPEFNNGTREKYLCKEKEVGPMVSVFEYQYEIDSQQEIITTNDNGNMSVWGSVFLVAGSLMGIASTSLWTKGYSDVESETSVEIGACNITLMVIGWGFEV